jgi:hypothetical protein
LRKIVTAQKGAMTTRPKQSKQHGAKAPPVPSYAWMRVEFSGDFKTGGLAPIRGERAKG